MAASPFGLVAGLAVQPTLERHEKAADHLRRFLQARLGFRRGLPVRQAPCPSGEADGI
jgi:hypothetical protein